MIDELAVAVDDYSRLYIFVFQLAGRKLTTSVRVMLLRSIGRRFSGAFLLGSCLLP